jgi:tetratricopeptide (TPR) repeat protein
LEQAISDFNKALEIDPKSAVAYYNRGLFYFRAGQIDRAQADLKKAAKLDPEEMSRVRAKAKGDEVKYLELLGQ